MARWTDLAEWRGPTPNQGPAMSEQRGLIIHIAEGFYEGTIAWQKKPAASVSSHFVLAGPRDVPKGGQDGRLAQVVDTSMTAWTQRDGNGRWLSVECSGFAPEDALSPAQVEAVARLFARCHTEYGVPLQLATSPSGRGLGHHSMGAESGANWGHSDCPGPKIKAQKPAILARAIAIVNGDEDAMTPGQELVQHWMNYRVEAIKAMRDPIVIPAFTSSDGTLTKPELVEPNLLAQAIKAIPGIGNFPTADDIAEAVADELHERTAD